MEVSQAVTHFSFRKIFRVGPKHEMGMFLLLRLPAPQLKYLRIESAAGAQKFSEPLILSPCLYHIETPPRERPQKWLVLEGVGSINAASVRREGSGVADGNLHRERRPELISYCLKRTTGEVENLQPRGLQPCNGQMHNRRYSGWSAKRKQIPSRSAFRCVHQVTLVLPIRG
jgi:hypothetical protein